MADKSEFEKGRDLAKQDRREAKGHRARREAAERYQQQQQEDNDNDE